VKPLEGIRIVEAGQMISVPFATMLLAEQGAEVIKVELPDGVGDRMRFLGTRRGKMGALFHGANRGKKSVVLDTKSADGLVAMKKLIASADVFVQNFRPGAAERMGIGESDIRAEHPDLVYVSVSGFGSSGPSAGQKVYDYVIQAMTGMAALQSDETNEPTLIRQFVVDKVTALAVAQAITAAVLGRERGMGGQHLELSMLDIGLWFFWPDGMMDRALLGDGVTDAPHFSELYEVRKTTDGHIAIVASGMRTWPHLCAAFGPQWLDDPRFASFEDREANAEALAAEFDRAIAPLTTAEALERMRANDVPGAAIAPLDAVHLDPQVIHNESLVVHDNGPAGTIMEVRPAASFGGAPREVPGPAPAYGQHTDEVLAALGGRTVP